MTHLQPRTNLTSALAGYYDEVNEAAEAAEVHPGIDGINIPDADLPQARALAEAGAAHLDEGTRTLRLIGDPKAEDDDHDGGDARSQVFAKSSQFADPAAG